MGLSPGISCPVEVALPCADLALGVFAEGGGWWEVQCTETGEAGVCALLLQLWVFPCSGVVGSAGTGCAWHHHPKGIGASASSREIYGPKVFLHAVQLGCHLILSAGRT